MFKWFWAIFSLGAPESGEVELEILETFALAFVKDEK